MKTYRILALFLVALLVAAGCGRDEETADAPDATTAPATTEEPGGDGGLAAGAFGDLGVLCSPAPDDMELTASDVGVTADSIRVATVSDPGFAARPGLNQEMFDTAEAFTKWCNEHGGINGRTIDLQLRDAKFTEFQAQMLAACDEGDFFIAGGGAVLDDTGQKERLACGLPQIPGFVVTSQASGADLSLQPVPNPGQDIPVDDFQWLEDNFPDAIDHIGVFTGNFGTTVLQAERYHEAVTKMGWTTVYDEQYNAQGEQSWRPFVESMRSAGVEGLIYVGEPVNLASIMKAMADVGYAPAFIRADPNHYDPLFLAEGGGAVDNVFIRSAYYPFLDEEVAAENEATQQYLDLMAQYDPDGKVAYLGLQSLTAWLLFAQSAKECGANLTRDCVWDKARANSEWTGGGLHAPEPVDEQLPSECFVLFEATPDGFVQPDIDANDGVYNCGERHIMHLDGDYGTGTKCENPAYADDPKPSNCTL